MALSNYLRNKLVDWWYRGESLSPPMYLYAALLTAASPTSYTEQTAGGVARVLVARTLTAWAGTQGDGTTAVSSGTSGTTSNNAAIQFVATATAQVTASYVGLFDAATGGNLLEYYPIRDAGGNAITRNWSSGDTVKIDPSNLRITWT